MTFRISQRIVCVSDAPNPTKHASAYEGLIFPVVGQVYTVRGFAVPTSIWLVEIVNRPRIYRTGTFEGSFWTERFRPLVECQGDLAWAHEIVRSVIRPAKVSA